MFRSSASCVKSLDVMRSTTRSIEDLQEILNPAELAALQIGLEVIEEFEENHPAPVHLHLREMEEFIQKLKTIGDGKQHTQLTTEQLIRLQSYGIGDTFIDLLAFLARIQRVYCITYAKINEI